MNNFYAAMLSINSEELIDLYHNGFIICIAFAALFFVLSIVLFFVFDIRSIFDVKTGRAQKRKIDEMEKENALTGRLIAPNHKPGETGGFSGKLNKIKDDLNHKRAAANPSQEFSAKQYYEKQKYPEQAYKPQPLVEPPSQRPAAQPAPSAKLAAPQAPDGSEGTTVLAAPKSDDYGTEGTSVLGTPQPDDYGSEGTSVLGTPQPDDYGSEGTSVLGTPQPDDYGSEGTSVLGTPQPEDYGSEGTSVLGTPQPDDYGSEGTSVLGTPQPDDYGSEGTSVLGTPIPGELGVAAESIRYGVGENETGSLEEINASLERAAVARFDIVKEIILTHTQETID